MLFLNTPFKFEPSNFGSPHFLWIYYKWYFTFFFYYWVIAFFKFSVLQTIVNFPYQTYILTTSYKLEPSNFDSAHLLWIYYNWYFKSLDFFFICWVMALFKILCTTIHSKFPLSDLNSDHIVQARTFKILLSLPHLII